jgi:hypothetical protein
MRRTPRSYRRKDRAGVLASTELMFVLPILIYVALIIVQFMAIFAAYQRVQTAAIEGSSIAAQGGTMDEVEDAVGLALGYLAGGGFEVTRQYVDADSDTMIEATDDHVVVGVRIPMNRAMTNYLGLLGGDVDLLQIRSVVKRKLRVAIPGPPFDGGP